MSLDTRNSALFKRAEQLKRWEESDTNKEPAVPKNLSGRKIKFSSGCVFLAACMAGDKDEVLKLLNEGADINTANVDGLTALHQVCIDDNLEMVEFLVQNGADVNRQDNEGWTPLHATASCGFVSIASYLIENGADLAAINSDGDLCLDLASGDIEDLLQRHIEEQEIDCEKARQSEQRLMLNDAKKWLRSDASEADRPHPRTGATALHVAAAKGYAKVLGLLLAGHADVDKQDNDGWTPLHAAAHWGQKEAIQMLITSQADMDIKNYAGQTALDIAHQDVGRCLEELKRNNKRPKRKPIPPKIIDSMDNHIERPPKVIRVEVKTDLKDSEDERIKFLDRISESDNTSDSENDTDSTESSHSTSISEDLDDKPKTPNNNNENTAPINSKENKNANDEDAPWRRSSSLRQKTQAESPPKTQVPDKEAQSNENEVILRRTQSFENDDKFYQKYRELQARIKANSCPVLPATQINVVGSGGGGNANNTTNNYSVQRSASLKDNRQLLRIKIPPVWPPVTTSPATTPTANTTTTTTANPTTPTVRSPTTRPDDFISKRYGSVQHLPSGAESNEAGSKFGGSALNLMTPNNDPFNRVLPPRQAASITNIISVNEQNGASSMDEANNISKDNDDLTKANHESNQQENVVLESEAEVPPPPPPLPPPQQSTLTKLSPGNIFKNFFKSFVPPARDEESETQRKAHAKRVRETRRSTQGVTLDEFKSAEEFVKKKNMSNNVTNSTDATNDKTSSSLSTTTTTQSSEISDRIPSTTTSSTDDNQSVTATVITDNSKTIISTEPAVTASYTITTLKRDNIIKSDNDNKISASYTIVPPNSNNNSNSKPSPIDESKEYIESSPTITATINVPSNNLTLKTDTDDNKTSSSSTTTGSTTSTASSTTTLHNNSNNNNNNKLDDKNDKESDSNNTTTVPATTATIITGSQPTNRYIRDKRSLFDIDNASSLSLADKLRNEANKYNEVSATGSSSVTAPPSLDNSSSDNSNDNNLSINKIKIESSLPSSPLHQISAAERRPSWRLKFDAGNKFKLEDATSLQQQQQNSSSTSALPVNNTESSSSTTPAASLSNTTTSSVTQRRPNNLAGNLTTASAASQRPVSAPVISTTINSDEKLKGTANIANDISAYKRVKNEEDKENDKENDSRSAQATQAVIQRRRRPKRRSTGVVRLDKDELDPDRQESPTDGDEKESGSEISSRSRLDSTNSAAPESHHNNNESGDGDSTENGEFMDYKALWEASKIENDKLKIQLKKKDEELYTAKSTLDRFTNATTKNSLSEIEKRERRAMERKMSEMEEELKLLQKYKTENERLRAENRALTRVVAKLTTSAQNQLHKKQ